MRQGSKPGALKPYHDKELKHIYDKKNIYDKKIIVADFFEFFCKQRHIRAASEICALNLFMLEENKCTVRNVKKFVSICGN